MAMVAICAALVVPFAGCSVYDEPPRGPIVEDYQPDNYEGAVVYFEGDRPYTVVGEEVHYVPAERPEYETFRAHYHHHSDAYQTWYRAHPPHRRAPGGHEGRETRGHRGPE